MKNLKRIATPDDIIATDDELGEYAQKFYLHLMNVFYRIAERKLKKIEPKKLTVDQVHRYYLYPIAMLAAQNINTFASIEDARPETAMKLQNGFNGLVEFAMNKIYEEMKKSEGDK